MIAVPAWLLSNWRALAMLVVVCGLGAAVLWYRGEAAISEADAAKARGDLVEFQGAYNILAAGVHRQNAAVHDLEAKGREAAERGAKARAEAAGVVDVAVRSAEALARRMREPAVTECPAGEGLAVVREDWRR